MEDLFSLGAAFGSAFYTWHCLSPFCFRLLAAGGKEDSQNAAISDLFTRLNKWSVVRVSGQKSFATF